MGQTMNTNPFEFIRYVWHRNLIKYVDTIEANYCLFYVLKANSDNTRPLYRWIVLLYEGLVLAEDTRLMMWCDGIADSVGIYEIERCLT